MLFSGGKDSTYTIYLIKNMGSEVARLITVVPEREDSWMFHTPNILMTKYQASSMCIKHDTVYVSGIKEKEVEELKSKIESMNVDFDAIAAGVVASRYQKDRLERLCEDLGLEFVAPLWGMDSIKLLKDQISSGFEFIITSVSAEGLDESWLGRRIDDVAIEELLTLSRRFGINISFEGGEAETFVLDCPLFKNRLIVRSGRKSWRLGRGIFIIDEIDIVEK